MLKKFLLLPLLALTLAAAPATPPKLPTAELAAAASAVAPKLPTPILLWAPPAKAPNATGDSEEDQPAIYPFLPSKEKNTGAAIIVAPGGGFSHRAVDYEGILIANYLNDHGIAAFVLRYRIGPLYSRNDATLDGQRSIQFVRAHAADYNISPDRVGLIGFSAGSELGALVAFKTLAPKPDSPDLIDRQPSNLNYLILAYGSSPGTVDRNFPPTFMFCTAEDRGHATGMINLYWDLYNAQVPAEIHIFPRGEHGVGLANGDAQLGLWPELMINWLKANNTLTSEKRAAIKGHVTLDGKPLPHGSVTFIPVASPDAKPGAFPVTAYIMNTNTPTADFTMNTNAGPVPGKYRVEIRQDANLWISSARDPAARLPQAEKAAYIRSPGWGAPTIDALRVFKKAHPTDTTDLTIDIKPGDNNFNLEVFSK